MFDFFTLVFVVLLLMEAIGGVLLVGWWMQRRGDNSLAWWSFAHGMGVLVLWAGWYTMGGQFRLMPYSDMILAALLLLAVVPAFCYVVVRMLRAEAKVQGVGSKSTLWRYLAAADPIETDQLANDLRSALAKPDKQLSLQYQPIFNASTRTLSGFEALLRWNHPVRGSISPAQFIPIAESSGVILPLGRWVLETACATAARWPKPWSVSVNVSPLQLRQNRFVGHVREALAHSKLAPARLQLEVTEGVMIDSASQVMSRLADLRHMGARVAIDDFGTGYSSLRYLERMPCDTIKIDRSFVHDLEHEQAARSIAAAVIKLCHELGHDVVAEGVETEGQLRVLNGLGCQKVQGWLLGKAMAPDSIGPVFGQNPLYEGGRAAQAQAEQAEAEKARALAAEGEVEVGIEAGSARKNGAGAAEASMMVLPFRDPVPAPVQQGSVPEGRAGT